MTRSPWAGKGVLITAGPTREHLDPIRYLTNSSSGRMGLELAAEARARGASVTVVLGPTAEKAPAGVRVVRVVSALDMRRAVLARSAAADVVIASAAVVDWRFARIARRKIKKGARPPRLTLEANPDIIKEVGRRRAGGQILVGFALETHRAEAFARRKMREKGLDLIVANGPSTLGRDRMSLAILSRSGPPRRLRGVSKEAAAKAILSGVEDLWNSNESFSR